MMSIQIILLVISAFSLLASLCLMGVLFMRISGKQPFILIMLKITICNIVWNASSVAKLATEDVIACHVQAFLTHCFVEASALWTVVLVYQLSTGINASTVEVDKQQQLEPSSVSQQRSLWMPSMMFVVLMWVLPLISAVIPFIVGGDLNIYSSVLPSSAACLLSSSLLLSTTFCTILGITMLTALSLLVHLPCRTELCKLAPFQYALYQGMKLYGWGMVVCLAPWLLYLLLASLSSLTALSESSPMFDTVFLDSTAAVAQCYGFVFPLCVCLTSTRFGRPVVMMLCGQQPVELDEYTNSGSFGLNKSPTKYNANQQTQQNQAQNLPSPSNRSTPALSAPSCAETCDASDSNPLRSSSHSVSFPPATMLSPTTNRPDGTRTNGSTHTVPTLSSEVIPILSEAVPERAYIHAPISKETQGIAQSLHSRSLKSDQSGATLNMADLYSGGTHSADAVPIVVLPRPTSAWRVSGVKGSDSFEEESKVPSWIEAKSGSSTDKDRMTSAPLNVGISGRHWPGDLSENLNLVNSSTSSGGERVSGDKDRHSTSASGRNRVHFQAIREQEAEASRQRDECLSEQDQIRQSREHLHLVDHEQRKSAHLSMLGSTYFARSAGTRGVRRASSGRLTKT